MWTAKIILDDDKATASIKVGTATATWNAGEVDEFSYSERISGSQVLDLDDFVANARAALTKKQAKEALELTISDLITTKLNA